MGLWDKSIAHYREAIAREPRNVSIRVQGACEVFLRLRRFDETRELLEEALKIAPDDTTSRACLAQVEMQLGRLDAAQSWLERVSADLHDNYEGDARMQLLSLRRDAAALAAFMQPAVQRADAMLSSDDITGLILLGFAQRDAGHADLAHDIFQRLARVFAADPGGIDHVSSTGAMSPLVYAGLGDWPTRASPPRSTRSTTTATMRMKSPRRKLRSRRFSRRRATMMERSRCCPSCSKFRAASRRPCSRSIRCGTRSAMIRASSHSPSSRSPNTRFRQSELPR